MVYISCTINLANPQNEVKICDSFLTIFVGKHKFLLIIWSYSCNRLHLIIIVIVLFIVTSIHLTFTAASHFALLHKRKNRPIRAPNLDIFSRCVRVFFGNRFDGHLTPNKHEKGHTNMKLGFVSAILDDYTFEQTIDTAKALGFGCVEAACWPKGKAERRYAGVTHIDVDDMSDEAIAHIHQYCSQQGVAISALAFYPNTMDADLEKRAANVEHLKKVIRASARLGINMVTTFIGRDQYKSVEENLALVKEIWPPIIALAEELNVKIAIENCPMLFGKDQWPGGQNLMTTPSIWRKVFSILNSDHLGINYDPSHFVWQRIDYIKPIYEFKDKIFHVHYKDIKLYADKLDDVGTMAYPLEYMSPKLPGLGDVDWGRYVSALTDIGYDGYTCIEIEDKAFEGSDEKRMDSLRLTKRYMEQFVI